MRPEEACKGLSPLSLQSALLQPCSSTGSPNRHAMGESGQKMLVFLAPVEVVVTADDGVETKLTLLEGLEAPDTPETRAALEIFERPLPGLGGRSLPQALRDAVKAYHWSTVQAIRRGVPPHVAAAKALRGVQEAIGAAMSGVEELRDLLKAEIKQRAHTAEQEAAHSERN